METSISDLYTGYPTPWQIVGKCVNKRRHDSNSKCPFLRFDLSDSTATIEVVSFRDVSFEIDDFVQVGEYYRIRSAHADIKHANPIYTSNPCDIVIKSVYAITLAHDPSPALSSALSSALSPPLPPASPPHDPSAFLSITAIRDVPDAVRCCFRGRVQNVNAIRETSLSKSRDVILSGADEGDTVRVKLLGDHAESIQDGDHSRGARMEIKAAKAYRSPVTDKVTLDADKHSEVSVTFDRPDVSASATANRQSSESEARVASPATDVATSSLSSSFMNMQFTIPLNVHGNRPSASDGNVPSIPYIASRQASNQKRYVAFISHAGPDKETLGIPLYEQLRGRKITAFIDREEMLPGDTVSEELLAALNNSMIGIFILSPEFVARKWPMKELHCFLERRREAKRHGLQEPTIIPIFHRWGPKDYKGPFFETRGIDGEEIFKSGGFFKPERQREMSTERVRECLKEAKELVGVFSDDRIRGGDKEAISKFIVDIGDAVTERMTRAYIDPCQGSRYPR